MKSTKQQKRRFFLSGGGQPRAVDEVSQHEHAVRGAPLPPETSLAVGAQALLLGESVNVYTVTVGEWWHAESMVASGTAALTRTHRRSVACARRALQRGAPRQRVPQQCALRTTHHSDQLYQPPLVAPPPAPHIPALALFWERRWPKQANSFSRASAQPSRPHTPAHVWERRNNNYLHEPSPIGSCDMCLFPQ